jgi:hypothetical protein
VERARAEAMEAGQRFVVVGGLPSHAVGTPGRGVDDMTFNQEVMGSNPIALTSKIN